MEDIERYLGAITIDNSILKAAGYRFDEGLLKQMEQFKNGPVKIVQTDIVHKEAKKHIASEVDNSRLLVEKALCSAAKQLEISDNTINNARKLLSVEGNALEIADNRLKNYYEKVGAEILESHNYIDFERLLEMYFEDRAPFENAKDKKNEFPDAIALLSLEKWAEEHGVDITAVSRDKGWIYFAEHSKRITVIKELSDAIAKFQPHNQVKNIIKVIREDEFWGDKNTILSQIKETIVRSLESATICAEASSAYRFEDSDVNAKYIDHWLDVDEEGLVAVNVIRIEDRVIVLHVQANITCEISATFSFFVRDSIDRDDFEIGSASYAVEDTYVTDVLISLTSDFANGLENLEVANIEILQTIKSAEFGEIEPDWRDYEDSD